jgi:2-polyprenyl-3-methyl-5-hydroxy-6-metoxy-1,4-benzoquinol methylase
MGTSHPENKNDLLSAILRINPKTVLDVGAGSGGLAKMLFFYAPEIEVDAIEVWEPYVSKYELSKLYRNVFVKDAREFENFDYDIVVFGDILEHMKESEAIKLWEKASKVAKYGIITIPIIHMPQEAVNDNPYEVHEEEDWSTKLVLSKFKNIEAHKEFDNTGIFVANFKGEK